MGIHCLEVLALLCCRDPARERVMKEASRKLKNVKLQYTDPQEAIFFEDVAGIGDAKVRDPIPLLLLTESDAAVHRPPGGHRL